MKTYTVRYAHLETLPKRKVGSKVNKKDKIGKMGNTGQSFGAHLHIDVVLGTVSKIFRLSEVGYTSGKKYHPSVRELNFFLDRNLFDYPYEITTFYADPRYRKKYNKDHYAYDVISGDARESRNHYDIYWNRSFEGTVVGKGYDNGYGNYILISYTK